MGKEKTVGEEFEKQFQNPSGRFRGAPFWSWNGRLVQEHLKKQMDDFKEMGFGGFHIHSRIGLQEEYLGEKFLDSVEFCRSYGESLGMQTYLYDEDKWPSGYGGGRVTKKEEYRARYLLFSPYFHENGHYDRKIPQENRLTKNGDLMLLYQYEVKTEDGRLLEYTVYPKETIQKPVPGKEFWYAYLVVTDPLPWFNNQAYGDTLNKEAVEAFLKEGYEPYAKRLEKEFSRTIPSIFTDEPQFSKMECMHTIKEAEEIGIPFTESLESRFLEICQTSLLKRLPELFWLKKDGSISRLRYQYGNLLSEQFAENYAGTLGAWCEEHQLMLAGHLMEESRLESQFRSVGDTMRCYAQFQLPGIDMLADAREYTTAKQAQSVSRQMGRSGVISELYGVTNWNFDFRGHKLQGDWQAALGVTVRVPHLSWMYMGGESKRDYPAPIDSHSPWYRKYPLIEDHFARVNVAMTRGKAVVHVGVVHPIESMFMEFGPEKETIEKRSLMEEQFQNLTRWLLFGLQDFDFLSEALLPELSKGASGEGLCVGEMKYQILVVPELTTIRKTTLDCLESFGKAGGKVVLLGNLPEYLDGEKSELPKEILFKFEQIGFEKDKLLKALEPVQEVKILTKQGMPSEDLIYQMREEGDRRFLFVVHGTGKPKEESYEISLKGNWILKCLDTLTGEIREMPGNFDGTHTWFEAAFYAHDSLLLEMTKRTETETKALSKEAKKERKLICERYLPSITAYHLEEDNVLLLDQAKYRLDGGEWKEKEEILKIDDKIREQTGYRKRTDSFPQPWISREGNQKEHLVELCFAIQAETKIEEVFLAFEGDMDIRIFLDGVEKPWTPGAWFVDEVIHKIKLGDLEAGSHELRVEMPFGNLTNLEWFYLLGKFGVMASGDVCTLTKPQEQIGYGDVCSQGLPFYGGPLVYETEIIVQKGTMEIEVGEYEGALTEVSIDGGEWKSVVFAPYTRVLGEVEAGTHTLRIRCYGTRINTFGQLHNCNPKETYFGPTTWRTTGKNWCYTYRLHSWGILKAPVIRMYR